MPALRSVHVGVTWGTLKEGVLTAQRRHKHTYLRGTRLWGGSFGLWLMNHKFPIICSFDGGGRVGSQGVHVEATRNLSEVSAHLPPRGF